MRESGIVWWIGGCEREWDCMVDRGVRGSGTVWWIGGCEREWDYIVDRGV